MKTLKTKCGIFNYKKGPSKFHEQKSDETKTVFWEDTSGTGTQGRFQK